MPSGSFSAADLSLATFNFFKGKLNFWRHFCRDFNSNLPAQPLLLILIKLQRLNSRASATTRPRLNRSSMLFAINPRLDHFFVLHRHIRQLFDVERHLNVANFDVGKKLLQIILDELSIAVGLDQTRGHHRSSRRDFKGISTGRSTHHQNHQWNKKNRKNCVDPKKRRIWIEIGDGGVGKGVFVA